jgi:hypothetical protein
MLVMSDNFTRDVIIDFDGINIISSSIADEIFGKLDLNWHDLIMKKLRIRNANEQCVSIIQRAIEMRERFQRQ